MYIVKTGFVEVVSEDGSVVSILLSLLQKQSQVFVRLGEGTVFGELAILNIPGNKNGNRRTANVRSVGYSDLYVLSKEALWDALRQYPEANKSLMRKGTFYYFKMRPFQVNNSSKRTISTMRHSSKPRTLIPRPRSKFNWI